jgi:hypothetical protein
LPADSVEAALVRIAESLTRFASIVSFDRTIEGLDGKRTSGGRSKGTSGRRSAHSRSPGAVGMGTLWLDVTGIGHLFGGERELSREVVEAVRRLGHQVRVTVANGPILAQAFARWPTHEQTVQVLSDEEIKAAVRWLPITALPVEPETQTWLARLWRRCASARPGAWSRSSATSIR